MQVVFDGECPPCKRDEALRREQADGLRRTRALEKGIIAALRAGEKDYVVAPYEAVAQLQIKGQKAPRVKFVVQPANSPDTDLNDLCFFPSLAREAQGHKREFKHDYRGLEEFWAFT